MYGIAHICIYTLTSLLGKEAHLIPLRYSAIFGLPSLRILSRCNEYAMNMAICGSDLHTHPQWWRDHHVVRTRTDIPKHCTAYYWSTVHL